MHKPSLLTRMLARVGLQPIAQKRGAFAGAVSNRLTLDWILTPIASADAEQKSDLRKLRARARELNRNTSVGTRFPTLVAQNVIGPEVRFQAKTLTNEGKLFTRANTAIEDAFKEWSRVGICTLDGKSSFLDALDLSMRTLAVDGEVLIELVEGDDASNDWGFALNILDADLLDEQLNRPRGTDGTNEIRQGVEINRYGRPIAYWMHETHPSDSTPGARVMRRVPADRIVHLFIPRRPGQTRGTTWFAPILMDQRMLAGYYEAELVAARVAASKMGAIEQSPEFSPDDGTTPQQPLPVDGEPGSFFSLNPGEKLSMFNPEHPVAAFKDFTTAILHHVAAGLNTSYGTLTGDLSQANYGSMRVGMLAERDVWKRLHRLVREHLLDRIYRAWLRQALLRQQLMVLNSFDAKRWTRVEWQFRGFPWISPKEEIDAAGQELAMGLTTRTRLAAERGIDFEEACEERAAEMEIEKKYGLDLQVPMLGNPLPQSTPADDKPDDKPDDKTDSTSADDEPKPARSLRALP